MLTIIAYAFSIMYSPGPINLLGLHCGINKKIKAHIGFFIGVGFAMLILFLALGFLGNTFINAEWLPYTSLLGCLYITYIALQVFKANVTVKQSPKQEKNLSIWNGLLMQLLNPKGLIATLPIATIQFPAARIEGTMIIFCSIGLSILAFGAPFSYSLLGGLLGKKLNNPLYFKIFNILMGLLLFSVSISIAYEFVFLKLI